MFFLFNILKNFLIIYLFFIINKINKYKNIKENFNKKKYLLKLKNKNLIKENMQKNKKIFYFGYILCSNKCPKFFKKIKNKKIFKKNNFIFLSINKKENSCIIEKNLNKFKKKNIKSLYSNLKKKIIFSKIFKIIYKYKKNRISHSQTLYNINIKNKKYINIEKI
ncbi:hypothetical protein [Candidatus Nasuia deltocephalinicola]|uniref:hypothetical protein n=1 Tax=Candidatus Nasuia deltocephalincola TaxID=1160784 RepID=UPI00216B3D24|nr:hypothetical protein [Candidatus Nasuia deltocephalinicola]